jgi:hypothetical protein
MIKKTTISRSVQDKHIEIHYNQKTIYTSDGPIMIRLQGKIHCPVLNTGITPMVCAKLMDSSGWPRCMDSSICEHQANCFISKSIKKNMAKKVGHGKTRTQSTDKAKART